MAFDQSEFFTTREAISLSRVGYIYVPHTCAAEPCRLHVAFHGCKQDLESVHDDFIRDAGYNQWAASNSIVVLYPQATGSAANPNRCWDFWGYSGSGYFGRTGRRCGLLKAWWIGFSAQAREGAQGLLITLDGWGLPQREERLHQR